MAEESAASEFTLANSVLSSAPHNLLSYSLLLVNGAIEASELDQREPALFDVGMNIASAVVNSIISCSIFDGY